MTPLTREEMHGALRKIAADYKAFVERGPAPGAQEDPKAFTAHHTAARSALAHLEHLMKLAPGEASAEAGSEAGALIAEARRSIRMAEQEDGEMMEDDDQS